MADYTCFEGGGVGMPRGSIARSLCTNIHASGSFHRCDETRDTAMLTLVHGEVGSTDAPCRLDAPTADLCAARQIGPLRVPFGDGQVQLVARGAEFWCWTSPRGTSTRPVVHDVSTPMAP